LEVDVLLLNLDRGRLFLSIPSASLETQGIKAQAADGFCNGCTQVAEEQKG